MARAIARVQAVRSDEDGRRATRAARVADLGESDVMREMREALAESHSTHRAPEEDPSLQPSSEEQATVATVAKSTELEGPPEHAAQRQGCGLCRRRRAAVAPE